MAKTIKDPGVGTRSDKQAKRFINQDGSFNIKHINRSNSLVQSYEYLLSISWPKFFLWVLFGFVLINVVFASIYTLIGISDIIEPSGNIVIDFLNAFFFSSQTLTTVGYGALAPKGVIFGLISSLEALVGLLCFSFVTGLLYGRFSKPRANIQFSKNMILRNHKGVDCIMFRLMSRNSNVMIKPNIDVTLTLSRKDDSGNYSNSFYKLALERDAITYLPTTWTIVHPIDDVSPLQKFKKEELSRLNGEILLLVSYYDESFAQEVHQIHSYILENLNYDQKFIPAFYYDDEGNTILDHNKLDRTQDDVGD